MIRRLVDRKKEIRKILEDYPDGIHFNALVKKCASFASRATLKKLLSELVGDSEISHTPEEPRRGQKVYYRLTESSMKFNEQLKVLDREGDLTLNEIYWLHYILEKSPHVVEGSLLVEFDGWLYDQYGNFFSMAEILVRPFPEKFQKRFYNHAFEIFKNMHLRYIIIVKDFLFKDVRDLISNDYPEMGAPRRFDLRTSPYLDHFKNIKDNRDCYLDWLKNSDDNDYRRIGLFVEKNRKRS